MFSTKLFIETAIYTVFGLVVFGLAFWIITLICPFSMRKEIEEDQNTALAILIGAVMVGLSIIIAATVHG